VVPPIGEHHILKHYAGYHYRVHLDFLGPLPETPRGNTNILVMVDQFTKWCEIVPLPSQTAKTTAKAAVNEFFARLRYSSQSRCDSATKHRTASIKVRLYRSTCPLAEGLKGVVLVLWIWKRSHIAENNLLSKFRPWSVCTEKESQ
jgi:hypothetical protein